MVGSLISTWAGMSLVFPMMTWRRLMRHQLSWAGERVPDLPTASRKRGPGLRRRSVCLHAQLPGLLTVSGQCAKEVADLVPNRIVECVKDRRERRFSEEELKKAKRIITVNAIEQFQTVKGLASDLGLNWLYARNLDFSRHYLDRLKAVTPADLERAVSLYLTDSNLTVAVLRPGNEPKRISIGKEKGVAPQLHVLSNGAKAVLIPDDVFR